MTPTLTPTRLVSTLPFEVRLALAACEDAGMGVDEYRTGSNEPVFYEVKADFIGCPASIGAVMGMVTDTIRAECDRYGVNREHSSVLRTYIQTQTISRDYNSGLKWLMSWVGVSTPDED